MYSPITAWSILLSYTMITLPTSVCLAGEGAVKQDIKYKRGDKKIYVIATHPLLSGEAVKNIDESLITKIEVISIAGLFIF